MEETGRFARKKMELWVKYSLGGSDRHRLRELCRTEGAQSSDFWEIFNPNPLVVGCFEDQDWEHFFAPLTTRGMTIDTSARKEISNWTGGIPILASGMLQILFDESSEGAAISKTHIDAIGPMIEDRCRDIIGQLWDDCTPEIQSNLAELQAHDLALSQVSLDHRRELEARGFGKLSGSNVKLACKILGNYARQYGGGVESLRGLFGDAEKFSKNVRTLLELRLGQIPLVDPDLTATVKKAIRDLNEPGDAVAWARRIANRGFELIWNRELPDGQILASWASYLPESFKERHIPKGGGACRLLQIATETDSTPRMTKYVTKRTYAVLNFIHSVGDHGQHLKENEVTWSYAALFCYAAIELCESLAVDFKDA